MLYQLPADGTWAQFDLKMNAEMGDFKVRAEGSLRMASVGRSVEQGEPCRWIEADLQMKVSGIPSSAKQTQRFTVKVLIPEKHLKAGASPLDHVVRGWIRENEQKVVALADPKEMRRSPLPVVLAGPLKDAKRLEPIEVESKLGKLSCPGVTGVVEVAGGPGPQQQGMTLETRRHQKAPFGVVTSNWKPQMPGDADGKASMVMEFKLSDLGTGAKSELPEQK